MDAFTRFAQAWLDRAARIGADPRDDEELRLRKALLVLVCVLILPISLAWGAIYLALGVTAGLLAWLYTIVSVGAIAVFSRSRDTEWLLRVELLDILLAPTRDEFELEPRGTVPIKGKGDVETWFLVGRRVSGHAAQATRPAHDPLISQG